MGVRVRRVLLDVHRVRVLLLLLRRRRWAVSRLLLRVGGLRGRVLRRWRRPCRLLQCWHGSMGRRSRGLRRRVASRRVRIGHGVVRRVRNARRRVLQRRRLLLLLLPRALIRRCGRRRRRERRPLGGLVRAGRVPVLHAPHPGLTGRHGRRRGGVRGGGRRRWVRGRGITAWRTGRRWGRRAVRLIRDGLLLLLLLLVVLVLLPRRLGCVRRSRIPALLLSLLLLLPVGLSGWGRRIRRGRVALRGRDGGWSWGGTRCLLGDVRAGRRLRIRAVLRWRRARRLRLLWIILS